MNVLLLTLLFAAHPVAQLPTNHLKVIDGDTVTADIILTDDLQLVGQSLRAANYDAWESFRTRRSKPFSEFTDAEWKAEQVKGTAAKVALIELLNSGQLFVVLKGRDVYGRLLAEWYVYREDTDEVIDVAEWMSTKGHTRR